MHIVLVSLALLSDHNLCCYKCQYQLACLPYMPTVGTTLCDNSNCKAAVGKYEICVFGNLGKTRMFVYRYRGIGGRSRDDTHSDRGEYTRYIYQFDKSVVTKLIRGGSGISKTEGATPEGVRQYIVTDRKGR